MLSKGRERWYQNCFLRLFAVSTREGDRMIGEKVRREEESEEVEADDACWTRCKRLYNKSPCLPFYDVGCVPPK
eukprot:scaffold4097_cov166-Amphora_coffeaeformis.AAC.63